MNTAVATNDAPLLDTPVYLPALNTYWPGQGGIFRGLKPNPAGGADLAVIEHRDRSDGKPWKDQVAWAAALEADGHKDFALPDRPTAALLYAVAKGEHEADWYWTSEPHGSDGAWYQYFSYGGQGWLHQSLNFIRGCAVRSFPIR